jgi:type IV pilus assembly protein PilO
MGKFSDRIAKLSLGKWVATLGIACALILGVYVYLVYLPQTEELQREREEQGRLEVRVRELRIVAANMKRFQEEAAKLREELKLAIAQLPTSKEIPSLLANISNLGKESGLEFLLFRPAPEINREFYAEIPVEIRVRGSYTNVAIFFDKVAKLPRIVNISGVIMEGAKEVLGKWEIQTSCTATTFKFIEGVEKAEASARPKEPGKEVPSKVPPKK